MSKKYSHSKGYSAIENGFAVGAEGEEVQVINSDGNLVTAAIGGLTAGEVSPGLIVVAEEALSAGHLVYISGWDADNKMFKVKKAKADATSAAGKCAHFVAAEDISQNEKGTVKGMYELTGQNSNFDVGTAVYLSTTAGGWTNTAPSTDGQSVQYVGVVTAKSATVGKVLLFPFYSKVITA